MSEPATNDVNRDSGPENGNAGSLHRMVRRGRVTAKVIAGCPLLLILDVLICATTDWKYKTLRRESAKYLKEIWKAE